MSFLNFFKIKKEKDFLVLDFGKGSVKGIIFKRSAKKNKILKFQTEKIERFGVFDGKDFEMDIIKQAANKVIENLGVKNKISEFEKILGFSPDIVRAEVFNVSFERKKKEEKITKKEKEKIYESILKDVERKLFRKKGRNLKILKNKILEKKISNYEVPSILDFKGEKLDFKVLVIFSSKSHFEFLETLKTSLNLKPAEVFHEVEGLVNFLELKNLKDETLKIFIDIGDRNTLVAFFRDNLEFIDYFQVGGYNFTETISRNLGLREADAEILKEDFSKDKLSSKIKDRVSETVSLALGSWRENFQKEIRDKIEPFGFSGKVYLFGGGSLFPLIKKEIEEELKAEKVKFLLPDNLPIKNKTGVSFSARETPSLLLSIV